MNYVKVGRLKSFLGLIVAFLKEIQLKQMLAQLSPHELIQIHNNQKHTRIERTFYLSLLNLFLSVTGVGVNLNVNNLGQDEDTLGRSNSENGHLGPLFTLAHLRPRVCPFVSASLFLYLPKEYSHHLH